MCSRCSRVLRERDRRAGGVLSGGEQQMLTICRTLMGDPELVMIDEPTEGLAPQLVEQVRAAARADRRARRRDPADRAEADDRARHLASLVRDGAGTHRVRRHAARELRDNDAVRKEWLEVYEPGGDHRRPLRTERIAWPSSRSTIRRSTASGTRRAASRRRARSRDRRRRLRRHRASPAPAGVLGRRRHPRIQHAEGAAPSPRCTR